MSSTPSAGSGGFIVTSQMRKILQQPGYISEGRGGHLLRQLYSQQSLGFNVSLLPDFALCCCIGNLEAVKRAVEAGSCPDLSGTETPFKFGYATLVVCGAQRIQSGPSPLQHAETLKYLLSCGCPPDVEDIAGHTALSHVTMSPVSRPDLARLLLEGGADVNHQDRYGCPPIMNAFQTNLVATVDILMEFNADLDTADADDVVPRTFFVSCGPQIAHVVSKWLQKRAGEEAPMAEKVCANCRSQRSNLRMCAKCHTSRYCNQQCQRAHWPTHKQVCHPFSLSNTVTLKPYYSDNTTMMPIAPLVRQTMSISTEPTPERHFRSSHTPKSCEPKRLIIKVQIPYTGPGGPASKSPLLVYTKKRDFVCQIRRVDDISGYDRISQVVRSQGVGGAKAYFAAELKSADELVVKVSEILATQPF